MTPNPKIFDNHRCSLGEGPLWHPERRELFWFDINAHQMFARNGNERRVWQFDDYHSAAGWVDANTLLLASATGLWEFDIQTDKKTLVCALEADNSATRTNDGRADPFGGFWIGTMGINLEPNAGAIYRYYKGELRQISGNLTVTNAQCFSPDGTHAMFTDTPTGVVWRQRLDPGDGWPIGEPEKYLELDQDHFRPDGAVVDADGNFWCAHYGHAKVTCHDQDGMLLRTVELPARATTCPAFGGPDLSTLFVTTASQNMSIADLKERPNSGCVFSLQIGAIGQPEHQVIL